MCKGFFTGDDFCVVSIVVVICAVKFDPSTCQEKMCECDLAISFDRCISGVEPSMWKLEAFSVPILKRSCLKSFGLLCPQPVSQDSGVSEDHIVGMANDPTFAEL